MSTFDCKETAERMWTIFGSVPKREIASRNYEYTDWLIRP